MESSKRAGVILWASVAAAAAGIIAVAAIVKIKERALSEQGMKTRLRDVQEVLSDCYQKIREIETHLPDLHPASGPQRAMRVTSRPVTNGNPA